MASLLRSYTSRLHRYSRSARAQCNLPFAATSQLTQRRFNGSPPADLDSSKLVVHKVLSGMGKPKSPKTNLKFGKEFTDHMLEVDWDAQVGWHAPTIKPYGPFIMDPASSVLHYALEAFEGMKAYIDDRGNVRLFRPDMNARRMQQSCEVLSFPKFSEDDFLKCLAELIKIDKDWIPVGEPYSLYLRPTIISTHPFIGVAPAQMVKLFVIMSPVGAYYSGGFVPVKLYASEENIRAWPGGCGAFKVGSNYGPTIRPQQAAVKKGYDQILWLYGEERYVTEVGTMNQFFHWVNEDGEEELVTAPLSQGVILPGVTRDSVLQLAREWGEFKVTERRFTMGEVVKAVDEGRVKEAFGSGTAAVVSPVKTIWYKGKDYTIPVDKDKGIGPLAERVANTIKDIQYGRKEHEWSVIIDGPDKQ